jgi:hypothetical protein
VKTAKAAVVAVVEEADVVVVDVNKVTIETQAQRKKVQL